MSEGIVNVFERASRLKLRFDTNKGMLSVEDLWELPLTSATGKANLDDIARGLHRDLQEHATVSFVDKPAKADESIQVGFDVVKYVIDVRLAEADTAAKAKDKRAQKDRIMELIDKKRDEALSAKSEEELRELMATL